MAGGRRGERGSARGGGQQCARAAVLRGAARDARAAPPRAARTRALPAPAGAAAGAAVTDSRYTIYLHKLKFRRACMISVLSASLFYANAIETFMTFGAPIGPFGILNQ